MAAAASNSTTSSGLVQAVEAVKAKFDVTLTTNISWRDLSAAGALALDLARSSLYRKHLPTSSQGSSIWSLTGCDDTGATQEYIFTGSASGDAPELVDCQCVVMFDDMALSSGLEYCFADELPFPTWHLTKVSLAAFEFFKTVKFKAWEKELRNPSCEAAFRRLLQAGPVYRVFDAGMFPTPPELADAYKVLDEKTGKTALVPHPIAQCRIWNPAKNDYDAVNAELQGAPTSEAEAKAYWANLLAELKTLNGEEYIEDLIKNK